MATVVDTVVSKHTSAKRCFGPGVSEPRLLWGLGLWLDGFISALELLRLWELLTIVTEAGWEHRSMSAV